MRESVFSAIDRCAIWVENLLHSSNKGVAMAMLWNRCTSPVSGAVYRHQQTCLGGSRTAALNMHVVEW